MLNDFDYEKLQLNEGWKIVLIRPEHIIYIEFKSFFMGDFPYHNIVISRPVVD